MPLIAEDAASPAPKVLVGGSVAVELDWALGVPLRPSSKRDHPALEMVYARSPALAKMVESFWGPDEATSWGSSIELQVMAHHAGMLFSLEAEDLLGHLEQICAAAPTALRLASEPEADRAALLARLHKLRTSASARRRYVNLVTEVWSALAPYWAAEGRAAVEASVAWRAKLVERGAPWREVAGNVPECCTENLVHELEVALGQEGAVAIVPAFFASGGSFVDLPGIMLIGQRAGGALEGPGARTRMEPLARQLKALSDPTRLAMLEALSVAPLGVSELAQRFRVAQPTASNHVKLLREAGLVSNGAGPDRHKLRVQEGAVATLLENLGGAVLPGHHGP
jgi:hypothetical protein